MNYSIVQIAWGLGLRIKQVERLITSKMLDAYQRNGQWRVTRTGFLQFCICFGFDHQRLTNPRANR